MSELNGNDTLNNSDPHDEETGRLVEFPSDDARMPTQRLPRLIGKITPGHPLQRPMTIAIIILGLILLIFIAQAIIEGRRGPVDDTDQRGFSEMYREEGRITYQDDLLDGWFLDEDRQHFMALDGRRFTYVDSHTREGSPVTGYWRLIE